MKSEESLDIESSDESVKHPVEPRARIPMLPPVLVRHRSKQPAIESSG